MASNKFTVPSADRKEFDLMVQRANRRIQASLRYIQQNGIESDNAQRALVGDYADINAWHTSKTVFSRSKTFASEKAYRQYVRHVEQWGGKNFERSVESVKEGYYKAIIQALTTTAIDNGNGVLTAKGTLPGGLAKKIRELSLEQMANFFEHSDPTEDIEYQGFRSDEYIGVDRGEFVDITTARLNALSNIFPNKAPAKPTPKKKKRKSKKRKSKKRKKK